MADQKDGKGRSMMEGETKHAVRVAGVDPCTKVVSKEREQEIREYSCKG